MLKVQRGREDWAYIVIVLDDSDKYYNGNFSSLVVGLVLLYDYGKEEEVFFFKYNHNGG